MKRLLVLCNGNPPSQALFQKYRANTEYIIAADGGGNIALDWGIDPEIIIGDLDSFEGSDDGPYEIIFQPDQNSNDLEKALTQAIKERGTHITVLGATGLRLDHTLKNLSVLKQFQNQFNELHLIDDFGITRLIESPFEEDFEIGTKLSLFPLSGKVSGITTEGLKYQLKNEALENGIRDGSSNEVIKNKVQITYGQGDLLLFIVQEY